MEEHFLDKTSNQKGLELFVGGDKKEILNLIYHIATQI